MSGLRVVIVGGGLAGMTAAYELVRRGMDVLLIDAAPRLGGKAGADLVAQDHQEHGNHFFPPWYLNTRRLMEELGILGRLVDMTKLHLLKPGRYPQYETMVLPTRLSHIPWNIFAAGHLPWAEAALLVYSFLDLASQGNAGAGAMDDVSLDRFLASRPYGLRQLCRGANAMMVKSIATPADRLSAMTKRSIVRCWLRYRLPMYSVLNTDLQRGLIQPFERALCALGCRIELGRPIRGFEWSDGRVWGVRTDGGVIPGDLFVSAVPCEAIGRAMDSRLLAAAGLGGVPKLESVPMGSMMLYLKRPIPALPAEHVILDESRYALSFIDASQTWGGCRGAVLTFNIGDVAPLLTLPASEATERIIAELCSFVTEIGPADVDRCHLRLNVDTPLLMNSTGSWSNRPAPGRTGIRNLFVAGDYCRSAVNITSMEGAVASGLATAGAILEERGLQPRWEVLEPLQPPLSLLKGIRAILFPGMLLLGRLERSKRGAERRHADMRLRQ